MSGSETIQASAIIREWLSKNSVQCHTCNAEATRERGGSGTPKRLGCDAHSDRLLWRDLWNAALIRKSRDWLKDWDRPSCSSIPLELLDPADLENS